MENEFITWQDFEKVKLKVGTIIHAEVFKEARKPAYKLKIDFGEFGIKKTSAQITKRYTTEQLINKQVVAVVNFPPKQIANFMSECLILGALGEAGDVTLLTPDAEVTNGSDIA
ncbi:MAG: tRNA-binding protein [Bacteroidota bacterium]